MSPEIADVSSRSQVTHSGECPPEAPQRRPGVNKRGWVPVLLFALIGVGFWVVYFSIGRQLAEHHMLGNDVFFQSDTRRVIRDMCMAERSHLRTNVHPLFVLLLNPVGVTLAKFTGSVDLAAVVLNSLLGATSIALAGWFLTQAGIALRRAVLFALLLGCSAAHLFFGAVPETYSLSALSAVLLFLALLKRPGDYRYFVPAGILSFGVLITNLAVATLAFASSFVGKLSPARYLREIGIFVAAVVIATMGLATLQKTIWSGTALFFVPATYAGESKFIKVPNAGNRVIQRESSLFQYVLVFDWFAPRTVVEEVRKRELEVSFNDTSVFQLPPLGMVAAAIWLACIAASGRVFLERRLYLRPVHLGLLLSLMFNLGLHSLYGDELFLYACNTCFLLVAWVALCMAELPWTQRHARAFDLGLLLLVGLEIVNNAQFVATISALRRTVI